MEVEDARLSTIHHSAYRFETRAVEIALVLAVLNEATAINVALESWSRHEVIVLSVQLRILARSTRVCNTCKYCVSRQLFESGERKGLYEE